MTTVPSAHYVLEDRNAFLAACITSAIGSLVFNAFPLFLSATADQYGLNLEQIGWLASIYLIGFAAITLAAPIWMSHFEWRACGVVSGVLMVGAVASWGFADRATMVYAAYCILGAGAGMVFTIGLTILARARRSGVGVWRQADVGDGPRRARHVPDDKVDHRHVWLFRLRRWHSRRLHCLPGLRVQAAG